MVLLRSPSLTVLVGMAFSTRVELLIPSGKHRYDRIVRLKKIGFQVQRICTLGCLFYAWNGNLKSISTFSLGEMLHCSIFQLANRSEFSLMRSEVRSRCVHGIRGARAQRGESKSVVFMHQTWTTLAHWPIFVTVDTIIGKGAHLKKWPSTENVSTDHWSLFLHLSRDYQPYATRLLASLLCSYITAWQVALAINCYLATNGTK